MLGLNASKQYERGQSAFLPPKVFKIFRNKTETAIIIGAENLPIEYGYEKILSQLPPIAMIK